MIAWDRTRWPRRCGFCGGVIPVGEPIARFSIPGRIWLKIRCRECAGVPVPDDLPPPPTLRAVSMTPVAALTSSRDLARDWKRAALGREPDEDDR